MTSGQSIFGFLARVIGTALAMVSSLVIWYIVDQKTPGVIIMLWFFIFMEMYLFLKYPRFIPAWLVFIVTQVLIIGYELQVRKIGVAIATSQGQPFYPLVSSLYNLRRFNVVPGSMSLLLTDLHALLVDLLSRSSGPSSLTPSQIAAG